jgi:hypothetical protein
MISVRVHAPPPHPTFDLPTTKPTGCHPGDTARVAVARGGGERPLIVALKAPFPRHEASASRSSCLSCDPVLLCIACELAACVGADRRMYGRAQRRC